MNKEEFLHELKSGLAGKISKADIEEILNDYNEVFEEGIVSGKSTDEITAEIGYPSEISKNIIEGFGSEQFTKTKDTMNNKTAAIMDSLASIKSQIFVFTVDWFIIPILFFIVVLTCKFLFTYPNLVQIKITDILLFGASCLFPPTLIIAFLSERASGLFLDKISMYDSLYPSVASQKYWAVLLTFIIIIAIRLIFKLIGIRPIGQRLENVKIVKNTGKSLNFKTLLYREIIGFIATFIATPIVSLIVLIIKKQSLADYLSNTIMIKAIKKGAKK